MKVLKAIVSSIVAGLVIAIAIIFSELNSLSENSAKYIEKYSQLKQLLTLLKVSVLLLILLYLPYLIKIIKVKYRNYQQEKNKPINLIEKPIKDKIINSLGKLNKTEKDVLFFYYIEHNNLCHKFDKDFSQLEIIENLYDKGILYKPYNHDNILDIDNYGIKYYKYCINEIAKNYLDRHRKLLK